MRLFATGLVALMALAAAPADELKLGEVVADATFKAYDGKEYKLSDFRANAEKKTEGQVVVVYFQSQKCPAAIAPDLVAKVVEPWKEAKAGVKVIAIYSYGHDTEKGIQKYIEDNKFAHTCVWDTEKKFRDHFGAKQVNQTFVLDKTGKLVYRGGLAVMQSPKKMGKETVVEAVKAAMEGKDAPKSDARFAG